MICSICGGTIEKQYDQNGNMFWDKGHNAQPINNERCCGTCNTTVVIPARIERMKQRIKEELRSC